MNTNSLNALSDIPTVWLDMRIGGRSVGENLCQAMNSGALIQQSDGMLTFPVDRNTTRSNWLYIRPYRKPPT
ncbi:hypothetical protein CCP3SC1_2030002 [Gammaproteobacteria bacterium]